MKISKAIISIMALTGFVFSLGSCSEENKDPAELGTAITVTMNCTNGATNCANNSADGKSFLAAVLVSGETCATFGGDSNEMQGYVIISGVSCSGGTCSGSGTDNLKTPDTDAPATSTAGTLSYFAFIDMDGDTSPDNGEPFGCSDNNTFDGSNVSVTINMDMSGM
ncbi:MAG: hypothetical protein KDD33_06175 [Bdellovibrionales bacterium]|nr:hypothetical protein [Bdellovibrionales bacterium]